MPVIPGLSGIASLIVNCHNDKIVLCCIAGKFHGRVAKLAKAPGEGKLQDGLITFTEGQTTLFCSYGSFQVAHPAL